MQRRSMRTFEHDLEPPEALAERAEVVVLRLARQQHLVRVRRHCSPHQQHGHSHAQRLLTLAVPLRRHDHTLLLCPAPPSPPLPISAPARTDLLPT